jgi:hypothetical protein
MNTLVLRRLGASFWFVPVLMVLASMAAAVALVETDLTGGRELAEWSPRLFGASAEGSRVMLSAKSGELQGRSRAPREGRGLDEPQRSRSSVTLSARDRRRHRRRRAWERQITGAARRDGPRRHPGIRWPDSVTRLLHGLAKVDHGCAPGEDEGGEGQGQDVHAKA